MRVSIFLDTRGGGKGLERNQGPSKAYLIITYGSDGEGRHEDWNREASLGYLTQPLGVFSKWPLTPENKAVVSDDAVKVTGENLKFGAPPPNYWEKSTFCLWQSVTSLAGRFGRRKVSRHFEVISKDVKKEESFCRVQSCCHDQSLLATTRRCGKVCLFFPLSHTQYCCLPSRDVCIMHRWVRTIGE